MHRCFQTPFQSQNSKSAGKEQIKRVRKVRQCAAKEDEEKTNSCEEKDDERRG